MKFNTTIYGSFGTADGAVEFSGSELIVYRKSLATRVLFGALGTALAGGKEYLRFTMNDVISFKTSEKRFKSVANIVLKDNTEISFDIKADMNSAVNDFVNAALNG